MTVNGVEVPRVMLHARSLGFRHPVTEDVCEYERPCPPDMTRVIEVLEERLAFNRLSRA